MKSQNRTSIMAIKLTKWGRRMDTENGARFITWAWQAQIYLESKTSKAAVPFHKS